MKGCGDSDPDPSLGAGDDGVGGNAKVGGGAARGIVGGFPLELVLPFDVKLRMLNPVELFVDTRWELNIVPMDPRSPLGIISSGCRLGVAGGGADGGGAGGGPKAFGPPLLDRFGEDGPPRFVVVAAEELVVVGLWF